MSPDGFSTNGKTALGSQAPRVDVIPGVLLFGFYSNKQTNKQTGQHGLLILKAEPAHQLVDNADLSRTWSVLQADFMLKARPSWVKLKRHEWNRLSGFTARGLFQKTNKQTDKQTNKQSLRGFTIRVLFNQTNKQTNDMVSWWVVCIHQPPNQCIIL